MGSTAPLYFDIDSGWFVQYCVVAITVGRTRAQEKPRRDAQLTGRQGKERKSWGLCWPGWLQRDGSSRERRGGPSNGEWGGRERGSKRPSEKEAKRSSRRCCVCIWETYMAQQTPRHPAKPRQAQHTPFCPCFHGSVFGSSLGSMSIWIDLGRLGLNLGSIGYHIILVHLGIIWVPVCLSSPKTYPPLFFTHISPNSNIAQDYYGLHVFSSFLNKCF